MFPARALFAAVSSGDTTTLRDAPLEYLRVFDPVTGDTLAHIATQKNNIDCIRVIAERLPELFISRNLIGHTPLMDAAMYGYVDIAKTIIEAAPEAMFFKDIYGKSPLLYDDILNILSDDIWSVFLDNGHTLLHEAAIHDLQNLARMGLDKNPDALRATTSSGMTPIHYAAFFGRTDIASLFLRACPECITFMTENKKTPLFCAAEYSPWKNSKIIRRLFDACPAMALVQDERGRTPVFEIAKIGIADDLRFMLDAYPETALIQEKDKGWTPLHVSLYGRYNTWVNVAKTIVSACPESLDVEDASGKTPLDHIRLATNQQDQECGDFLVHVLRYRSLPDDLWEFIPYDFSRVSSALGSTLTRSEREASYVVERMTREHRARLRTALLLVSREQNARHTYSGDVVHRVVSKVFE